MSGTLTISRLSESCESPLLAIEALALNFSRRVATVSTLPILVIPVAIVSIIGGLIQKHRVIGSVLSLALGPLLPASLGARGGSG